MIGPVQIALPDGGSADLFLLRFSKDGSLLSKQTAAMAVERARTATDVYVFSHGWNNVFADAKREYTNFIQGYIAQREEFGLTVPDDYRPVLIGIIWPSTWFVKQSEEGPAIAATAESEGMAEGSVEALLDEVGDSLPAENRATLIELLDGVELLDEDDARQAAGLVSGLWKDRDETSMAPPDLNQILMAWAALDGNVEPYEDDGIAGVIDEDAPDAEAERFVIAGGGFDPRTILRLASVWKIKSRAGLVGRHGVGPVLADLLESSARLHLIGHSYGARVLLSAIARTKLSRSVHSLLLLQPAVNRWCFAKKVGETEKKGGYANVPERVERPIMLTFSEHDFPLHEVFHLFVRGDNLGEFNAAAIGDTDTYGALGGYGPLGIAFTEPKALAPGEPYELTGEIMAVKGSVLIDGEKAIGGHGDVNKPITWWMLHTLTER
jgi:hypothetical protein